jgi:hypothetical protein
MSASTALARRSRNVDLCTDGLLFELNAWLWNLEAVGGSARAVEERHGRKLGVVVPPLEAEHVARLVRLRE